MADHTTTASAPVPAPGIGTLSGALVALAGGTGIVWASTSPVLGIGLALMGATSVLAETVRWDSNRCPRCKDVLDHDEFEFRGRRSLGSHTALYGAANGAVALLAALYLASTGEASYGALGGALVGAVLFTVGDSAYMVAVHERRCHRRYELTPPGGEV